MSALINIEASLRAAGHGHGHGLPGCVDAIRVREVDALVSELLEEIEVPFTSLSKKVVGQLSDLKQVLAADYREVPGMPQPPLIRELAHIVDTEIKTRRFSQWQNPECFAPLAKLFGPREVDVRAEPYRRGAGLTLRGFFCRASVGDKPKFVIFLNTAHHPGAVAATFGHELGHYFYGALVGEDAPMTAFMEGTFGAHLGEEHELFSDALVALAAYGTQQIKRIRSIGKIGPEGSENLAKRIHKVYESIGPRMRLDFKRERISSFWRVNYLTSMVHFFKLRCALLDRAGV